MINRVNTHLIPEKEEDTNTYLSSRKKVKAPFSLVKNIISYWENLSLNYCKI